MLAASAYARTFWRALSCTVALLACGIWVTFEPFWTRAMFNGFSAVLLGYGALCFWRPGVATSVLGAAIVLAGNHPGGRFQESLDIFLFLLLAGILWRGPKGTTQFTIGWMAILLVAAASLVAGAAHEYLAGTRLDLFYFLSAAESWPHYPFRMIGWILVVGLLVQCAGPEHFVRDFAYGLTLSLLAASMLAIAEAVSPQLRALLDAWHGALDNSVDRAVMRSPWPQLSGGLLTHASNSFFWNRTWFAAFLTASFGVAAAAGRFRPAILALTPLAVILSGSRGGLAALCCVVLSLLWFRTGRSQWFPFVAASLLHFLSPLLLLIPQLLGERSVQFQEALTLFRSAFVFGHGLESYGVHAFADRPILSAAAFFGTSHNQWLQVLSGMGLAGGVVYAGAMIAAYRYAGNIWLRAGLIGVSIHSAFQEFWYTPAVHLVWWVLIAACLRTPVAIRWRYAAAVAVMLLGLALALQNRGQEFIVVADSKVRVAGPAIPHTPAQARPAVRAYPARAFSAGGYVLIANGGQPVLLDGKQSEILPLFYGNRRYPLDARVEVLERGGRLYLRATCASSGYAWKGDRNPVDPCFWLKSRLD